MPLTFVKTSDHRYRLTKGPKISSVSDVIDGWQQPDFALQYRDALLAASPQEFFWEHPPVRVNGLDQPYEVALPPSRGLNNAPADPSAFQAKLDPARIVNVFPNLSGSAKLVVPSPEYHDGQSLDFGSIHRFLKQAEDERIVAFFRQIGQIWQREIHSDSPYRYLSTHGLGVIWLHVRFDRRPKYYHTRSYRQR